MTSDKVTTFLDVAFKSSVDFRAAHRKGAHSLSAEWFTVRANNNNVSASRVGAVLGVDPYNTVKKEWALACGKIRAENLDNNPHVQRGRQMEPALIDTLRSILPVGWCVLGNTALFQHPVHKEIVATPDGFVLSPLNDTFILEIKCPQSLKDRTHIQPHYALQMLAQMVATGARGGFFFECSLEEGWRLFFLARDTPFIERLLLPTVRTFISHVQQQKEVPRNNNAKKFIAAVQERLPMVLLGERLERQFVRMNGFVLCLDVPPSAHVIGDFANVQLAPPSDDCQELQKLVWAVVRADTQTSE